MEQVPLWGLDPSSSRNRTADSYTSEAAQEVTSLIYPPECRYGRRVWTGGQALAPGE